MSRVSTSTPNPAALARPRKLSATSLSFGQYSWNQRWPWPLASATSSIVQDAAVDMTIGTPAAAAARATATSPSGWAILSTPTGPSRIGAASRVPSTVLAYEAALTSVSIRGTIRHRRNAAVFSLTVSSVPAPPRM